MRLDQRTLTLIVLAAAAVSGCGSSDGETEQAAAPKGPPAAGQVQQSVAAIIDTCMKRSFDSSVDVAPVSEQVDRMIAMFKASDPDAEMGKSDLRATTLRQALTQVRDQVRECSPDDEDRINDTLTSVPAPAGADTAPTAAAEPSEEAPDPQGSSGNRGVATIAAELAPLCVDKIGSPGDASPEIAGLVDDLVGAYESGLKNSATLRFMENAESNMDGGCGPDQAAKIRDAIDAG
jgi:hypothetical protein